MVFAGGILKPGSEKEVPNRQKKWSVPATALGNAGFISDKMLSSDSIEEEDGELRSKDDRDLRVMSETEKNRVTWNIERRTFLDPTASKNLQDKIAKTRFWPLEVVRTPQVAAAKGGKSKGGDDDTHTSYHGIIYLNLAPLLYPGVKRIRGAYKVHSFTEPDLTEKTERKTSVMDEAVRVANGIVNRMGASPFPKPGRGGKEDGGKKDAKKGVSAVKTSDTASEGQPEVVNLEGQMYVESKSYAIIEISLERPLVPKRPPEELARRVAEYIPPRPMFPKRTDGAQRAVADFHSQVGVVANRILDEFRESYGEALLQGELTNSQECMEDRKQKLIYHLNSTGKYFAFKEQLKHAVVKIVREKYLRTTNFQDKDELQHFLSELYVYLVDQMHVGLRDVLQVEDQSPIPEPLTDSAQLKHFAREAEINGNFELSSKYYQERIARDKLNPDNWFDYGTFNLYINDLPKAEECFRECVSLNQRHPHGLILYGVVSNMQDRPEMAETFFEAATSFEPKSVLAWTMLGLFYDGIGNEIGTEMALLEANKLNVAASISQAKEARSAQEAKLKQELSHHSAPHDGDADDLGAHTGDDSANRMRSSDNVRSRANSQNRSQSLSQGHPAELTDSTQEVGRFPEEYPEPEETVFLQIVGFLLEVKALPYTERALAHHLLDEIGGPSAKYYVSLARLKLHKQAMEEAEEALKQALEFDHQNPDAWALMGHVQYMLGETEMAKDCYERTITFVQDAQDMHIIYLRLASIYLQESKFPDSRNTFLLACKKSPSCVSWLGVGIACYRMDELSEAEDALAEANVLNNADPEVWAYLSLVCLRTGRQLEAEQAYKYAIKLNLQDQGLVEELHAVQEEVGFGNPQL